MAGMRFVLPFCAFFAPRVLSSVASASKMDLISASAGGALCAK